jgi:glycosyltransferase involved in cell wall biosynthesis
MNIAITSLYLPGGSKIGVGYQVHMLANALVGRGHGVTVFSQCAAGEDARYATEVVPARRRLATFGFAWDLRGYDFSGFDVLNAHGDDWFLWGKRRPRHVHTYHGSCFAEMLHAKGLAGRARMGALALCEYGSLLLADVTVTVSENTRRYIPGIRHVIPCGVDTKAFSPGGGERSAAPSVLFVGTMHGRKRGAMLLEKFRREIRVRVPGAELWCVCDRPAGQADEAGVQWFGRVSEAVLVDLFRRAWVFCLPSTYEGFGVPYIEAMASGVPVVASGNPGAVEVTRGGRDGVIAEDGELGGAIAGLLTDPGRRDALRELGLARSRDFSWDRVCEQYEAVYKANGRRGAAAVVAREGVAQ